MSSQEIIKSYTDPSALGSFSGVGTFLKYNKHFKDVNFVKKTLESLDSYTLHRNSKPQKPRRKVHVAFPMEIQAMDLLDISDSKISRQNKGYKWILLFVDIFSRRIWTYALKDKSAESVSSVLDTHFQSKENRCSKIWADRDKSFLAKKSMDVLKKFNIGLYHTSSYLKSVFAERYIKEIKNKIFRIFTQHNNKKWLEFLPDITHSINNTVNPTTKFRPLDVSLENADQVWHNIYSAHVDAKRKAPEYKIGQLVRMTKLKNVFAKGYKSGWTDEIFKIFAIENTNPYTYRIQDMSGVKIQGTMYSFELTPVSSTPSSDDHGTLGSS